MDCIRPAVWPDLLPTANHYPLGNPNAKPCFRRRAALHITLIAPVTTMYYDSGFIIGLKAFVAAIIGGLVSFPITAIGALAVGLVESFASFWSGALKDVIVFSLLIPVLMLRSFLSRHVEEEEEEVDQ